MGRTVDSLVGEEHCKARASNCSGPTTSTYGKYTTQDLSSSFLATRKKRVSQTPLQRPDTEQAVSG